MANEPFKIDQQLTSAFLSLDAEPPKHNPDEREGKPKAVVIGGGTGASLSIQILLSLDLDVTAVVSMVDDGGSTGIIRNEANVTPPGDIRKCLCAMAADPDDPFTHAFRYRFEFARNHSLGNLMLSALEHETGSFPEAVRICGKLLNARGRVYPSTLNNVRLSAMDVNGKMLVGQAAASHSDAPLRQVWLVAPEGCHPYDKALHAIREADIIVLGPGSLFTSVIPNLLVPGLVDAIRDSQAARIFICNVSDLDGETSGYSAQEHVSALLDHGMQGLLDYVIAHSEAEPVALSLAQERIDSLPDYAVRPVRLASEDLAWIRSQVPEVRMHNMSNPEKPAMHNPYALRDALEEILSQCLSRPM